MNSRLSKNKRANILSSTQSILLLLLHRNSSFVGSHRSFTRLSNTVCEGVWARLHDVNASRAEVPVVHLFIEELVEIESSDLSLPVNTQVHAGNVLEDHEQDPADNKRVGRNGSNLGELLGNLNAIAVVGTRVERRTVESRDGLVGEDTSHEGSQDTANTMKLEDVESIIDVKPLVYVLQHSTDNSGDESDHSSEPRVDKTSSRGDADETGNCSLASTDN
ncbi:ammonium transporter, partial [Aureobasidium melanogenum]